MLAAAFVAFANHLLESAPWARDKLSLHAGKTALFDVFPVRLAFSVAAGGRLQPAPPEASPAVTSAPLPEAPVSITLKATLHGHEVMVTLRGVDFASVKAQVKQASEWLSVQAPAQPPTQPPSQGTTQHTHEDSPYCHAHNAVLKRYERNDQVWYSHKLANGQWCRGK